MVKRKTWKEFRESGLFWWMNIILHTFGWAIVMEIDKGKIVDVYPARVKFRGFSEMDNTKGYIRVSHWLKENINHIADEADGGR